MAPDDMDRLIAEAVENDPTTGPPSPSQLRDRQAQLRPEKEYEDIEVQEITFGFTSGDTQDISLYPEDVLKVDSEGNFLLELKTIGPTAEFVAYKQGLAWHSFRTYPHRRVRGTLRPDPHKMLQEMQAERLKRRAEKLQRMAGVTEEV